MRNRTLLALLLLSLSCGQRAEEREEKQFEAEQHTKAIDEARAPTPPEGQDLSGGMEAGKAANNPAKLFSTHCSGCHGADLTGSIGPNLTDEVWIHGGSRSDVHRAIQQGFHNKGMVAWGSILSAEQIEGLTDWVLSKSKQDPKAATPITAMHKNFWTLRAARNAVAHGDLELAKKKASEILEVDLKVDASSNLAPFVSSLHTNLRNLKTATTLEDAANLVTQVAVSCASCHQTTGGGPKPIGNDPEYTAEEANEAGLELLWLGVITPDPRAWHLGIEALSTGGLPHDVRENLLVATTKDQRAVMYSQLLKGMASLEPKKP